MINNSELIYLIVSCVDSKQLKDLVAAIVSQDIVLLKQPEVPVKVKATNKKAPGNKRQTKNSGPTSRGSTNKSTSVNTGNKKRKRNSGMSIFELKN